MYGGDVGGINENPEYYRIEREDAATETLWDELRYDPAKVLFGTKAKRAIAKIYIVDMNGEIGLQDLKYRGKTTERDLIKAFRNLMALGIVKRRREGKKVYYRINTDNLMGRKYKEMLQRMASMIILATEKVEKL